MQRLGNVGFHHHRVTGAQLRHRHVKQVAADEPQDATRSPTTPHMVLVVLGAASGNVGVVGDVVPVHGNDAPAADAAQARGRAKLDPAITLRNASHRTLSFAGT